MGPARHPIDRLAGWVRPPAPTRLDGTTATAVLPPATAAVEKHTQRIFAKLGLTQDEDQHRRVMAALTWPRS